jgi:hypothetical protein
MMLMKVISRGSEIEEYERISVRRAYLISPCPDLPSMRWCTYSLS